MKTIRSYYVLKASVFTITCILIAALDGADCKADKYSVRVQTRTSTRATALSLKASTDKISARQNETIELKVSLRNDTKKTVYVIESNPLADYKIEVRNRDGTLALPTEEGQKQLYSSLWNAHRLSVAIEPGQGITRAFDINKIYAMPAGPYNITVRRNVTTEWRKQVTELTSNTVRVKVID